MGLYVAYTSFLLAMSSLYPAKPNSVTKVLHLLSHGCILATTDTASNHQPCIPVSRQQTGVTPLKLCSP